MKHFVLFFLSDIHLGKTGQFIESPYESYDRKSKYQCIQTNESAIDYLMDYLGNNLDGLYYFSSEKTKEELTVIENGKPVTRTHEDWFKKRIVEKHETLKSAFHAVDYDENKDTDESIRQVTAMTELIKQVLDKSEDKDIRIYADMTGGFRHTSMMMLSVLQLLNQHKGIQIEKVLYSNRQGKKEDKTIAGETIGVVEDVTELHRMFTLVSGTDEFVNFGSVKEIDRYFKQSTKSPELEALLNTMREFADAIKICRTSKIEEVVKQLQTRIKAFSQAPKNSAQEEIFAQIITILQTEYGQLLSPKVEQVDIIEWCISKGFLQQAMTLCTEWLPFVLVKKKICYTDELKIIKEAQDQGKDWRTWEQNFFIDYFRGEEPDSEKEGYDSAIKKFNKTGDAEASAALYKEGEERLLQLFTECKKCKKLLSEVTLGKVTVSAFRDDAPMLEKACQTLWNIRKDSKQFVLGYETFLKAKKIKSMEHLLVQIQGIPKEYYKPLLNVNAKESEKAGATAGKKSDPVYKRENKKAKYRSMFENGIMKSKYSCDVMVNLLMGYYDIQQERNQINHAASDVEEEAALTKKTPEELMTDYLTELRKYI